LIVREIIVPPEVYAASAEFVRLAYSGMRDQRRSINDKVDQIKAGKVAEWAFCEFVRINASVIFQPDFAIYPTLDGVDQGDIRDSTGRSLDLDVKAVKENANYLLVKKAEHCHSEVYVTVVVEEDGIVDIQGWVRKEVALASLLPAGHCIPGTRTPLRVSNYYTRLFDMRRSNADVLELLQLIVGGKLWKNP